MRRLLWFWSIAFALLAILAGAATWLLATESGLHWAYGQLRTRLPGTLEIDSLTGRVAGPLHVGGVRYRSAALDADISRARLDWSPAVLLLGRLRIDALTAVDARIALKHRDDAAEPDGTPAFPLNVHLADIDLKNIRIERSDQAPYVIHSIELAGYIGQQIARIDRLEIDTQNFDAVAEGSLGLAGESERQLEVRWRIELPDQPAVAGAGQITGNLSDLRLHQQITEPIAASARARLREPFRDLTWELTLEAPTFDPRRLEIEAPDLRARLSLDASGDRTRFKAAGAFTAQTPDLPPLAGQYRLHGGFEDRIVVEQLVLRVPDTDMQLQANGQWQPATGKWRARAEWRNLRWPLSGDTLAASPHGVLDADGKQAQYRLQLNTATRGENLPAAQWTVRGAGDASEIAFDEIVIETLGTTLTGSASAIWAPALSWRAKLQGRAIDPAVAWPDWPGALALQLEANGDANEVRVRLDELRGTLRGQPFAADGRAVRRDDAFPVLALKLRSGSATAAMSGSLSEQWNIGWNIDAPDLDAVQPDMTGTLRGSGRITGPRAAPLVEAALSGARFAFRGMQTEKATLDAALDLADQTLSHIALRFSRGVLFDNDVERLALDAAGRLADHSIDLELRLAGPTLKARLRGAYANLAWNGTLQQSTLRLGGLNWVLAGSRKLAIARDQATLDRACWRADEAGLCLALQHRQSVRTTLDIAVQQVPLELFRPVLPDALELNGTVSGRADARLDGGRIANADARFNLSPGTITLAEPTRTSFTYESARLNLSIDETGLRANTALDLPKGDGGTAAIALPRFHSDIEIRRQPISGRIALTLRDLTPLDVFLSQIDQLSGSLRLDFALDGTLADPRLRGQATLADVAAVVPAAGIRVQRTRLTALANGTDTLQLSGETHSGGGQLSVSGRVTFPDDRAWRTQLRVTGTQFLVADLRGAQVFVSPDLRMQLLPGEVNVTGQVQIPQAMFAVNQRRQGVIQPSPDVVIVDQVETPEPTPQPWKVSAEIRVILGDAVRLSAFGLSARIEGDVLLVDAPGQATTGRGELRVAKGEYEAYGRKLDVERGRLLFVGGPVSNPGIDARAVRRVDDVTAGVEVKGTLQSPRLTLFSDPIMSESDTLSYMIFGRPMESATTSEGQTLAAAARALQLVGGERLARRIGGTFGIEEVDIETGTTPETAALVLGKQLSPRLYINYSIGLFEPANILRLRYRLSTHWSLEAQSGTSSGGDLLYTIER